MGVFGVLVCAMMLSSLRIGRSPVEDLWPLLQAQRSRAKTSQAEDVATDNGRPPDAWT